VISAAIERCAGIDVGKKFLAVCILVGSLEGEPRIEKRRYGTTMAELEQLPEWLRSEGITHAVMESTGSYWKPVFNVLEDSVRVYLANPQEVKNRTGHKTDDKDGWWLAHLLRHAMIFPSCIPPRPIRDFTRRRERPLGDATSERNRVQKLLRDANVKHVNATPIRGPSSCAAITINVLDPAWRPRAPPSTPAGKVWSASTLPISRAHPGQTSAQCSCHRQRFLESFEP
jgi:hypothetical protein